MKILHTADWHIGKYLNDYSLLEDQQYFIKQLYDMVEQQKPDVLVIAGDIYDRSVPSAEAVTLLNDCLQTLITCYQLTVLVIAGNHDSAERLHFGSGLLQQSGLYIAAKEVARVTLHDTQGEVDFHLVPYFNLPQLKQLFVDEPPSSLQEGMTRLFAQIEATFRKGVRNVLVAHGFFAFGNVKTGDEQVGGSEMVSIPKHGFDAILLGHLHGNHGAGKQAKYSGSPLCYSVDEAAQQKGVDLLTLEETLGVQTLPVYPLRTVAVVEGIFADLLEGPAKDDYVFIQLQDQLPIPDAALQLKSVYPHFLGLSYPTMRMQTATETTMMGDGASDLPLTEQFAGFYEQMTNQQLSSYQQEILHRLEVDA